MQRIAVVFAKTLFAKSYCTRDGDAIFDIAEFLAHIFVGLFELIGFLIDVTAVIACERKLGILIFSVIGLFCLMIGYWLGGGTSYVLFGIAGFCMLVVVVLLRSIVD